MFVALCCFSILNDVDQNQLAAMVDELYARTQSCQVHCLCETSAPEPAAKYVWDTELTRSGARLKATTLEMTYYRDFARPPKIDQATETYSDDGKWIGIILSPRDRKLGVDSLAELEGFNEYQRIKCWSSVPPLAFGNAFYGYSLANLVRDSERIVSEPIGRRSLLKVVTAHTKWGRFELILDPAQRYAPVRLRNWKGPNHLTVSGKKLSEFDEGDLRIVEFVSDFDAVKLAIVDGTPVIASYRHRVTHKMNDGSEAEVLTETWQTKNWRFLPSIPERTFDFECRRPDGLAVHVMDRPTIYHEWRDGQIVKVRPIAVDKIDAVKGYTVRPGDATAYYISAGVFALVGVGLTIWRWRAGGF